MSDILGKFLMMRGVLYLVTRFGGSSLRRRVFARLYSTGVWTFTDKNILPEMVALVEKYADGGCVLDLGCGTGRLAAMLSPETFSHFMGVDISPEAITRANQRNTQNSEFEIGDIQHFSSMGRFDLIVFEESLYYINPLTLRKTLRRYSDMLCSGGVILVTITDPDRFLKRIGIIQKEYQIVEKGNFPSLKRQYWVFR